MTGLLEPKAQYDFHTERLLGELGGYVDVPRDQNNVIDIARRSFAGAIHIVTSTFESLVGDAARLIQGKEDRVPLEGYRGEIPRTRLNVKESLQSVGKLFRGKFTAILTPIINLFKLPGDIGADIADHLGGVRRPSVAAMVDAAMASEGPPAHVDAPMPAKRMPQHLPEAGRKLEPDFRLSA